MKELFVNIRNILAEVVTEFVDNEYGYTKEVEKINHKKKLRKKPKRKRKKLKECCQGRQWNTSRRRDRANPKPHRRNKRPRA
jgi:hypothetical protein